MNGGASAAKDRQPCPSCGRSLSERTAKMITDGECVFCEGDE